MKKLFNAFVYFLGIFALIGLIGPELKKNSETLATLLFWFLCIVGAKTIITHVIEKHKDK